MSGDGLIGGLVKLCRGLRERGLLVTPSHTTDAVRALVGLGLHSRGQVYFALRCVLTSAPEDFPIFDELFWQLFAEPRPARNGRSVAPRDAPRAPADRDQGQASFSRWMQQQAAEDGETAEEEELPAASERVSLGKKDFAAAPRA